MLYYQENKEQLFAALFAQEGARVKVRPDARVKKTGSLTATDAINRTAAVLLMYEYVVPAVCKRVVQSLGEGSAQAYIPECTA